MSCSKLPKKRNFQQHLVTLKPRNQAGAEENSHKNHFINSDLGLEKAVAYKKNVNKDGYHTSPTVFVPTAEMKSF